MKIEWLALVLMLTLMGSVSVLGQVGHVYPSERKVIKDTVTGTEMTVLTDGKVSDAKIYQTHPSFTFDNQWVIFRGNGRAPGSQAYAVNDATGEIIQLTEGAVTSTGSLNLSRKALKLYYFRDAIAHEKGFPSTQPTTQEAKDAPSRMEIIELDMGKLFDDVHVNSVKPAATYERVCGALPEGMHDAGGFGLDVDENHAYISVRGGDCGQHLPPGTKILEKPEGARMGAGPGGLRSMDLRTGEIKVIIDTPFQVGHVQTNPWVPGEILYCWETGGKAPQRMWMVKADGSESRPIFSEMDGDWVTHETFAGPDEVMFNLIGHQKRLRNRPTGIAVINIRTGAMSVIGQIEEHGDDSNDLGVNAAGKDSYGGFWHCNGSPDGKWAVGDTFKGNVYMIRRSDGQRILWSTDHKMKPDHVHATFSPNSERIAIQSGHFTDGQRLQIMTLPVPKE